MTLSDQAASALSKAVSSKELSPTLMIDDLIQGLWLAESTKDWITVHAETPEMQEFSQYVSKVIGYQPQTLPVGPNINKSSIKAALANKKNKPTHLSLFINLPEATSLAQELGMVLRTTPLNALVAKKWNDKVWVRQHCQKIHVPIFARKQTVLSIDEQTPRKILEIAHQQPRDGVFIQLPNNESGRGNLVICVSQDGNYYSQKFDLQKNGQTLSTEKARESLRQWLQDNKKDASQVIIAPRFSSIVSPAISLIIEEDEKVIRVRPLALLEQILYPPTNAYVGNYFPPVDSRIREKASDLIRDALKIGYDMAQSGYRGYAGIDFGIEEGSLNNPEYGVIEVNARIQGSSAILAVILRNHSPLAFISDKQVRINLPNHHIFRIIEYLQQNHVPVFGITGNHSEGILIVTPPPLGAGKIWIAAIAADTNRAIKILELTRRVLDPIS